MSDHDTNQVNQEPCSIVPRSLPKDSKRGKTETERPLQYYENLMRHDAHCKVGGRVRQRRWGK